jgi:predicted Zn-dependent peptidase
MPYFTIDLDGYRQKNACYLCVVLTELFRHTLPNGLRVLFRPSAGETGHLAIFIHAGSRDEDEDLGGLAHFIEHTIFKGTRSRSMFQVLSRLDAVGGELNAYTTKEETCIYGSFHRRYLNRAADLIADITLNSTFPVGELEKEKEVIADEIRSYLDSPSEQIFDDFEQQVFRKHPLGQSILGTEESLKRIKRKHITDFLRNHYLAENMVLCITGPYTPAEALQAAEKYFSIVPEGGQTPQRRKFSGYRASSVINEQDTHQAHCVIGAPAYPTEHRSRTALALLLNILGGPAMNAKLHLLVREKHGLAYSIDAGYTTWTDSGLAHIYFGTDAANTERCLQLINRELKNVREKALSSGALRSAQIQFEGQLTIAEENKLNVMLALGRQLLQHNKTSSLADICKQVRAVTAAQVLAAANEILVPEHLSTLIYKGRP